MYSKINSIPFYKVNLETSKVPERLDGCLKGGRPLQMTFEVLNGRSYSEPQIFGPLLWFLLHTTAAKVPERLNTTQQGSLMTFLRNFPVMIPCQVCREHAFTNLKRTLGTCRLSTKEDVFRFIWSFHNKVNSQVANRPFTLAKAKQMYGFNCFQRSSIRNMNTGKVTFQPLISQTGYGPVFSLSLLIAAVFYPENPTVFTQNMMSKVIQNLGWMIPNPSDKEKALTFLSLQNVTLAVSHRDLLFDLFFRLVQHLFQTTLFRSLEEAKHLLNFFSFGHGQVKAVKYFS